MATYLGTHGSRIQNYTTDPDNPNTGEVWYNDTSNALKFQYPNTTSSWSTGGNVNTARNRLAGAGVNNSASLIMGGEAPPGSLALTESYDGSTWTEVNDLNQARKGLGGCGTQTSALGFGGNEPGDLAITESWNGTNWTEVNDMNTARRELAGAGFSNTNALAFGGYDGSNPTTATEEWNTSANVVKTISTS